MTVCAGALAFAGCAHEPPADDEGADRHEDHAGEIAAGDDVAADDAPVGEGSAVRRGLGTMTARVPGSAAVVGGVRLLSHRVRTVIQDGFSRTEVEEEFLNETGRVLEGRYVFPLPPGVSISRLGLWVGNELVEGEIVERERAARIFRGIVEDTVRPRDPALLEWVRGSEFSMTIFPIPAHAARKVVLAYDEVLRAEAGRLRYILPLSLGPERATSISDFAIEVSVVDGDQPAEIATPGWPTRVQIDGRRTQLAVEATDFVPEKDFVVELDEPHTDEARVVTHAEAGDETFAARLTLPVSSTTARTAGARARVIVLDASDSQSRQTFAAQARLALSAVRSMPPGSRFAVLACDSGCEAYPALGLLPATEAPALRTWLERIAPRGASDLAGALLDGIARLETDAGQLLVVHDGKPSAGELSTAAIVERVLPRLVEQRVDLRLIGTGRSLDEAQLGGLARALGASYEPLAGPGSLGDRIAALRDGLDRPVLTNAHVELPDGYTEVRPSTWPSLRLGEPITLVGKLRNGGRPGVARVTGDVDGAPFVTEVALRIASDAPKNPLLPRLWAEREMAEIDAEGGPDARARIVALSQKAHVLSRHTSLLVLENERMFRQFGILRTSRSAGDQSDHDFGRAGMVEPGHLGMGSPLASGAAFGSGRLGGSHVASAPMIRMGATRVSGRLPPESIQRIVRLQMRRFQACYERGLLANPNLAGRVSTRFLIDRTGAVTESADAGSDLADPEVVACVVRHFRALEFPAPPERNVVTVTYPIVFQSDGTRPKAPATLWPEPQTTPRQPQPEEPDAAEDIGGGSCVSSVHRLRLRPTIHVEHASGDERWRSDRAKELEALEQAAALAPTSRTKRERWVRALMQQGRFDRAAAEARRFVELDPDLALARELLAQSEAVLDHPRAALAAVDALAEADPRSQGAHLRAARAFAATGDERRACAHWRSLAELDATPASRARAESCTARATTAPASEHDQPEGAFRARVECESASLDCPEIAVVLPTGRAVSRAAPFGAVPATNGIALLGAAPGLYRTVLFGGDASAKGRVHLLVHGARATFAFDGGGPRTVATTRIEERWARPAVAPRLSEVRPIEGVAGALSELQRDIHTGAAMTGFTLPGSHRVSAWFDSQAQ